jgi:uncharacterized membrane protein YedE/YeeE
MAVAFVTALYWLTVLLRVTPMPTDWRVMVNDIGTYALVALGISQLRFQASKQKPTIPTNQRN